MDQSWFVGGGECGWSRNSKRVSSRRGGGQGQKVLAIIGTLIFTLSDMMSHWRVLSRGVTCPT